MNKPLLYALQIYDVEIDAAMKIAELHSEICGGKRYELVDVLLVYRRDCPQNKRLELKLAESFDAVSVYRTTRREIGFPAGPNGVWCDLMQHIGQLHKKKQVNCQCVLTTEADAFPLCEKWPEKLLKAWEEAEAKVVGHHLPNGDHACGHINGNALFAPDVGLADKDLVGCSSFKAWDTWFAPIFEKIGWRDIPEIRNWYRRTNVSFEELDRLVEEDCVWLHGVKDDSVIEWAKVRIAPKQKFSAFTMPYTDWACV